jgi:alkaline phosphatase D
MAVDFKTFIQIAPIVAAQDGNAGFPILLRGRHGVGKSQVVYQTAERLGLPVIERRASQMTEGDLVGLPSTDGDTTSFNPPDWFAQACREPVALFLDEVDRATIEVRQGIFELTDSRKLNGHTLHPRTVIFAAVNGGDHGAQYQVGEMDPAELDRWTVFDVEPTIEDWLAWAKDNTHGLVWDFINQNRGHLEHSDDFEPNKVYPSRRSWDRLNQTLVRADVLREGESSSVVFNLAASFVGFEAAVQFNDFVKEYSRQVSITDILDDGALNKVAEFGINDHSALVDKFDKSEVFKAELKNEQVANLAGYFLTLPSEVAMKLWTVLGSGAVENVTRLHQSVIDGKAVSAYIVELLTGTAPE